MFLIAGLGNPDLKYQNTKHNFGFIAADKIIEDYKLQDLGNKFGADYFTGEIFGKKTILIKPQEYMNLSGGAVLKFVTFHKIPVNKIIIIHDDLDLPLGKIKAKIGGGNGGHNGLKDIDNKIGKNYYRIRLGIGRPENPQYEISNYVLSKFNNEDLKIVEDISSKTSKFLPLILADDLSNFLTQINS